DLAATGRRKRAADLARCGQRNRFLSTAFLHNGNACAVFAHQGPAVDALPRAPQGFWSLITAIPESPDDDGVTRIPLQEGHEDLVAHIREEKSTAVGTGKGHGDTGPGRAIVIVQAAGVEEAYLHTRVVLWVIHAYDFCQVAAAEHAGCGNVKNRLHRSTPSP